ncbi:MAG: hypothetical protein AAFR59_20270, partial [Bacteroidota bacterium]
MLELQSVDGELSWSGPGISDPSGLFTDTSLMGDSVAIRASLSSGTCFVERGLRIFFVDRIPLEISGDTTICSGETFFLRANQSGGRWVGEGVDPTTGEVDLADSASGPSSFSYLLDEGTSCEQVQSTTVTVVNLSQILDLGDDEKYCGDAGIIALRPPNLAGGRWTGPGIENEQLGTINTSLLASDAVYSFSYCVQDTAIENCEACATREVEIDPLPYIDLLPIPKLCVGDTYRVEVNATRQY